jgi:hypothetical protein
MNRRGALAMLGGTLVLGGTLGATKYCRPQLRVAAQQAARIERWIDWQHHTA